MTMDYVLTLLEDRCRPLTCLPYSGLEMLVTLFELSHFPDLFRR